MADSEQVNWSSDVNEVDVNKIDVKCLIYVKGLIGERNKSVEILIDTGSSCNVMSKAMCKRLIAILQTCSQVLCGFNGMRSVNLGIVNVSCKIGKWKCPLEFIVVDHPFKTILGYAGLKQLNNLS